MTFLITKASDEQEPFDIKKFERSLKRAGAQQPLIEQLAHEIEEKKDIRSTKDIYNYALKRLAKEKRPVAARYNLKHALIQLGPSGFPFEEFVCQIFKEQGYHTDTDQTVQGTCISHEIDVVAHKDKTHVMMEIKFHNRHGLKTDVKVALYVKARFDDIINYLRVSDEHYQDEFYKIMLVTNTKFTRDATSYSECVGINLLSWSYPKKGNLAELVDSLGLHPITALTSLNMRQKRFLIEHGFVLCRHVEKYKPLLHELKLSDQKIKEVINESLGVCQLP